LYLPSALVFHPDGYREAEVWAESSLNASAAASSKRTTSPTP